MALSVAGRWYGQEIDFCKSNAYILALHYLNTICIYTFV